MTTAVLDTPAQTKPQAKAGKVILPLSELQAALGKISPAIPGASCAVPILRNVRIENTPDGTTFTASDLDLAIRATVPRMQDAAAPFLLSAERLVGYAKLLQGDAVSISPAETRATLKCGRSTTQLPLGMLANYPLLPFDAEKRDAFTLPQGIVLRMIQHAIFALSDEESRYTINGALLESVGGMMRIVATDGHRLALYESLTDCGHIAPTVLPAALLKAMAKALEDSADLTVTFADADSSIAVSVAGEMPVELSHRKIAGIFPNYKAIVPSNAGAVCITVNSTELLASINRCVAMSDRDSLAVKLTISPELIQMKAVDAAAGETEETIEVTSAAPFQPFVTGFNGGYLLDVLKRSKGDVTIRFANTSGQVAVKISSEPAEGETFDYIAMPMRV